ncbi:MAG TPA: rhomboid family intramembrane serine protease [Bacteroidia bacterium]|jgi:membrane associated rhomboid family serine protease|nr:rhomboid family intramembrane serine protease [Bacteroidia bacterium]HQF28318.1 rhomboid family intramembrane serine protease [Bacteroidia bacterium]
MANQFRPSGFQILPPVVKNLLIINGILYFATVVFQDKFGFDINEYLGLHYPGSDAFKPVQFVSYMFLHGSFMHIFFNMFALWTFGSAIENIWGPKRFLIFYFVCGIGAAVVQTLVVGWDITQSQEALTTFLNNKGPDDFLLFLKSRGFVEEDAGPLLRVWHYIVGYETPHKLLSFVAEWHDNPANPAYFNEAKEFCDQYMSAKINSVTVGASGAVYGLLLAFGMMFPNALLYIYFAIPIRAKYAVLLFGLIELVAGAQNSGSDNVAHFAHLGGMLFGFFLIKAWKKNQFRRDDF